MTAIRNKAYVTSVGQLYGKGVFTTLAIVESNPCLWDKHWHRLTTHATALGLCLSNYPEESVRASVFDAITESKVAEGRVRVTFYDDSRSRIWSNETGEERKTSLSIIVAERRPVPDYFRLSVSPHRINTTSPLAGIKSCNYLDHLLAYEEATDRGLHEAIRLNERGEITSACMANVFWEKYGKLFTPSLKTGCLPGTTREFVLENVDCEEVEAGIEELGSADRIFLTSAGVGVVAIAEFDRRELDVSDHAVTRLLPF